MITRKQIEAEYPKLAWDTLSDEDWNLLNEAMFNNNWDTVEDLYYDYRDKWRSNLEE